MPRLVWAGTIALAASACGRAPARSETKTAVATVHAERRAGALDTATPEAALRTYWRLSDAEMRSGDRALMNRADSLFTGPAAVARAQSRVPETFAREVVSVEQEGARAFVTARVFNTTPRPLGARPGREELRRRRTGDQFRYVLAHDASGWKIEQIQSRDFEEDVWRDWFDPTPRLPVRTSP